MLKERFVTKTWKGNFSLSQKTLNDYNQWVKFEKELNQSGRTDSTTVQGWQYSFSPGEAPPSWLEDLLPEINKIKNEIGFTNIKSSWAIEYDHGGYQDPHVHQPHTNLITIILNLNGIGELMLFDPRSGAVGQGLPILEVETLNSGEWFAMPGWLAHGTRPCKNARSILVIDGYTQ
jgi:hypothetical protein